MESLTVSIVTPSYNQNEFIASAMDSLLDQGYSSLEYVIVDGGSTDGSVDTIRDYAHRLSHWESGPDEGMYDALNKGFVRTSGEVMGWLNCDDAFLPWTLAVVGDIFGSLPEVEWLVSRLPTTLDRTGRVIDTRCVRGYSRQGLSRGEHFPIGEGWFTTDSIPAEATFWRRSLWDRAGGQMDASLQCGGDWELWARFNHYAPPYGVAVPLAAQRQYDERKSVTLEALCIAEAKAIMSRHDVRPRGPLASRWLARVARHLPPHFSRLAGAVHPTNEVIFLDGAWAVTEGRSGPVA